MASKQFRGGDDHSTGADERADVGENSYFFDIGTYEMMNLCSSCHMGGGPFEGIVQEDGSVIAYDAPSLAPTSSNDRDFYSYGPNTVTANQFEADSIVNALSTLGVTDRPELVNWTASGVMEADCMICHIDPDHTKTLMAADGVEVRVNRPRMMIFAQRDGAGNVEALSVGTPFEGTAGLNVDTAYQHHDHINRGTRPTPMYSLTQLPSPMSGDMIDMWISTLRMVEAGIVTNNNCGDADTNLCTTGSGPGGSLSYTMGGSGPVPETEGAYTYQFPLPYALYAETVPKIWTSMGPMGPDGPLVADYVPNPNGVMDEMMRLDSNRNNINGLFGRILAYMQTFTAGSAMEIPDTCNSTAYPGIGTVGQTADSLMPVPGAGIYHM
ncbi:MAG: hypothetical protein DRQ58_12760, partial [Gammaproteobacteria bacterium]